MPQVDPVGDRPEPRGDPASEHAEWPATRAGRARHDHGEHEQARPQADREVRLEPVPRQEHVAVLFGHGDHERRECEQHACSRPAAERGEREPRSASSLELGAEHGECHADRKPVEQARQGHHQRLPVVVERSAQGTGDLAAQHERGQCREPDPGKLHARATARAALGPPSAPSATRTPGAARRSSPRRTGSRPRRAHRGRSVGRRSATGRSSSRRESRTRRPRTVQSPRRSAQPSTPAGSAPRAGDRTRASRATRRSRGSSERTAGTAARRRSRRRSPRPPSAPRTAGRASPPERTCPTARRGR